jgi:hypothetical protein
MFWRSRPTVGRGRLFTAVTQQFARSGKRSNAEQIDRSGHDRREARRATIMRNTSLAALYGFPGVAAVTDAPVVRPGRTIGARVGSKVYGKHATHDIFVDFDAKSVIDLLGNADTTKLWIAALHLDDGRDELCGRAFRSGLSLPMGRGEQQTVFSMDQRPVEFEQRGRLDYRG